MLSKHKMWGKELQKIHNIWDFPPHRIILCQISVWRTESW